MSKVYSEQVNKTKLLLTGLKKNIDLLKNKGIDEQSISKLQSDNCLAETYDAENDKLKAEIRTKTHQAYIKLNEVKKQVQSVKKIIKRDFDKSRWQEFGINDKK
jgi:hypothetical protein